MAVITVDPASKASFVYRCMQTSLTGQYNGKWAISLVYVSKPLITIITATDTPVFLVPHPFLSIQGHPNHPTQIITNAIQKLWSYHKSRCRGCTWIGGVRKERQGLLNSSLNLHTLNYDMLKSEQILTTLAYKVEGSWVRASGLFKANETNNSNKLTRLRIQTGERHSMHKRTRGVNPK